MDSPRSNDECKTTEEVAPMKLNTLMRPAMLPTAVCSLLPVSAPRPMATPVAVLADERVWAPQLHQVRIPVQAELATSALVLVESNKGTTRFQGSAATSGKRYTDGGSGVPPRGRPV
jgi:hypothetical protein